MKLVKRTRARRFSRRKRVTRRKPSKVIKAYVKRAVNSKLENKRTCIIDEIDRESLLGGLGYYRLAPAQFITPGTTDRGRVGDTVYMTRITISYVFNALATANNIRPITWHWFVVKMHSRFATPDDVWYKSFDAGAIGGTYVALSSSAIQDGRRDLNTDAFTVLGRKSITLTPTTGQNAFPQMTGKFHVPLKMMKTKFNSNSDTGNGLQEFEPGLYVIGYPYTGGTADYANNQFNIRFCISAHYKD